MTRNEDSPKGERNMGQRLNILKILPFPIYFSGLQDASGLSQEFLHDSEVTSLIPACWYHCPGQAVCWWRIAGGTSLISVGKEGLTQKRAGEIFPNPYRKPDTFGN